MGKRDTGDGRRLRRERPGLYGACAAALAVVVIVVIFSDPIPRIASAMPWPDSPDLPDLPGPPGWVRWLRLALVIAVVLLGLIGVFEKHGKRDRPKGEAQ